MSATCHEVMVAMNRSMVKTGEIWDKVACARCLVVASWIESFGTLKNVKLVDILVLGMSIEGSIS
jgi:hypothetical protein